MKKKLFGFTLLELLIVISIIALLLAVTSVSYVQTSRQSRDARRKVDLEQLRGALEQYRANNNVYPQQGAGGLASDLTPYLVSGATKYIEAIPADPKGSTYGYQYHYTTPAGCGAACNSYHLGGLLENPTSPATYYVVTPYGATTSTTPPTGSGSTGSSDEKSN